MKTLNNFLETMETTEHKWIKTMYVNTGKYLSALNYIVEHQPKFIVEYGGGQSTLMITELVNYLDYGGKVIGYESDEYWHNQSIENGWNEHNNIKLVDIVEDKYNNINGVRYVHTMEDIQGVDFVIIDGPNLRSEYHSNNPVTTFNLVDIVNHLGYEVSYFIDGRAGTRDFYKKNPKRPESFFSCNYKTDIGDIKL